MGKLSGNDMFKALLVGLAILIAVGYVISVTGWGANFDLSNLGEIGKANLIWEVIIATIIIIMAVAVIGKFEAGTMNAKTFLTYIVLGLILYFLVKFLADMGFVDIDMPFTVIKQSVIP